MKSIAETDVFWDPKIPLHRWLVSADRLYDEARAKELDGDAEQAYVLYIKFLKCVACIV